MSICLIFNFKQIAGIAHTQWALTTSKPFICCEFRDWLQIALRNEPVNAFYD
jgi:hypothetical protein